jgi:hypothetical protein
VKLVLITSTHHDEIDWGFYKTFSNQITQPVTVYLVLILAFRGSIHV